MNILCTSLGCKLNQAEVEDLARRAWAAGWTVVHDPGAADWAVVNTCAVTHVAERKGRQLLRALHRANPALRIAITGCQAEAPGPDVGSFPGVALVVPNRDKGTLLASLEEAAARERASSREPEPASGVPMGHTRTLVKIQDGCDNACTYCYVRVARGSQRSMVPQDVLREVSNRVAEGFREVVLTGVHIGAYGRDSAPGAPLPRERGWSLARLVRMLLAETSVERLRLSSIEPWDLNKDLLECLGHPRVCRHVHLPLQSGSDTVLQRMGRDYDVAHVSSLVSALRARVPDVCVTTDVMVGFPGETTAEFEETMALVESLALSRLHVFTFSARPGTAAARMPDAVDPLVAAARSRALIALGQRLAQRFHERFLGRTVEVLFERQRGRDASGLPVWDGLSDHYIRVRAASAANLVNAMVPVRCLAADASGLVGELLA